nr:MAG TPA: hypothetical protein [Caudoviricetes sp.]
MTTYRLRDRKLQQKLDEISGGGFTEALMSVKKPSCLVFQARNGGPAMSIMLTDQDIELFGEYNPDDWNIYPDVTPPEGVWMRTEHRDEIDPPGILRKVGAVFQNGAWRNSTGEAYPSHISVKRYRPWE